VAKESIKAGMVAILTHDERLANTRLMSVHLVIKYISDGGDESNGSGV
jgi:hypothetical protein